MFKICDNWDSFHNDIEKFKSKANSKFNLKIKKALHINWRKPKLNSQQNHIALTLSM